MGQRNRVARGICSAFSFSRHLDAGFLDQHSYHMLESSARLSVNVVLESCSIHSRRKMGAWGSSNAHGAGVVWARQAQIRTVAAR